MEISHLAEPEETDHNDQIMVLDIPQASEDRTVVLFTPYAPAIGPQAPVRQAPNSTPRRLHPRSEDHKDSDVNGTRRFFPYPLTRPRLIRPLPDRVPHGVRVPKNQSNKNYSFQFQFQKSEKKDVAPSTTVTPTPRGSFDKPSHDGLPPQMEGSRLDVGKSPPFDVVQQNAVSNSTSYQMAVTVTGHVAKRRKRENEEMAMAEDHNSTGKLKTHDVPRKSSRHEKHLQHLRKELKNAQNEISSLKIQNKGYLEDLINLENTVDLSQLEQSAKNARDLEEQNNELLEKCNAHLVERELWGAKEIQFKEHVNHLNNQHNKITEDMRQNFAMQMQAATLSIGQTKNLPTGILLTVAQAQVNGTDDPSSSTEGIQDKKGIEENRESEAVKAAKIQRKIRAQRKQPEQKQPEPLRSNGPSSTKPIPITPVAITQSLTQSLPQSPATIVPAIAASPTKPTTTRISSSRPETRSLPKPTPKPTPSGMGGNDGVNRDKDEDVEMVSNKNEDEEVGEENGSGEGDDEGDGQPITKKTVVRIARTVVKQELQKSSQSHSASLTSPSRSPRRKKKGRTTALEEEKAREPNRMRLQYCALSRTVMKKLFDITTMEDFALHIPPQQGIIAGYTGSQLNTGPSREKLQIDMRGKVSSDWNQRVIEILVQAAAEYKNQDEEFKKLPARSLQYMEDLFKGQIERARVVFNNAQQKFKPDGVVESLEEAEQRMVDQKEKVLKDVRLNSRRATKFERRQTSLAEMLAEKKSGDDVTVLHFSEMLLSELGQDGMSSEDSCIEDGREVYRVRKMPHRRNCDGLLKMLDDHHDMSKNVLRKKGAKLATRIRSANAPSSRRPPFTGRSPEVFEPSWTKTQTRAQLDRLNMDTEKDFKWIDLAYNT